MGAVWCGVCAVQCGAVVVCGGVWWWWQCVWQWQCSSVAVAVAVLWQMWQWYMWQCCGMWCMVHCGGAALVHGASCAAYGGGALVAVCSKQFACCLTIVDLHAGKDKGLVTQALEAQADLDKHCGTAFDKWPPATVRAYLRTNPWLAKVLHRFDHHWFHHVNGSLLSHLTANQLQQAWREVRGNEDTTFQQQILFMVGEAQRTGTFLRLAVLLVASQPLTCKQARARHGSAGVVHPLPLAAAAMLRQRACSKSRRHAVPGPHLPHAKPSQGSINKLMTAHVMPRRPLPRQQGCHLQLSVLRLNLLQVGWVQVIA